VDATDRRRRPATYRVLAVLLALIAWGCSTGRGAEDVTETSEAAPPTTTGADVLASGGCPSGPPSMTPDPNRPVYRADLSVDPASGRLEGTVALTFTPDLAIDRLVLRLWANAPRQAAAGTEVRVDDIRVDGREVVASQPDPTTLLVDLGDGVDAGEVVDVTMDVSLLVAPGARDRVDRSGESLRLGSFLPLLAWVPGTGWAEDPPTDLFAEAATTPVADFDVALDLPAGYDVLATGRLDGAGRWQATGVRDFAASIGHFDLASAVVDAPDPVDVTVGVDRSLGESPQPYLDRVSAALVSFSERFGPYPWSSFSLAVTPGLGGGVEMPQHVMQGPGTVDRTTSHEVAHMWFYGLVGNNQGADPWLDESLASYAEATFEGSLDEFRDRPRTPAMEGALAAPLTYWADHGVDYYTGVYVQGALAVADLGAQSLVDCALRRYVADQAYGIAQPDDLVSALVDVFPEAPAALADEGVRVE
jgi:phage terminase large subunit-like protein